MNPLRLTQGIAIELSNLCDWDSIHQNCPLSVQNEVKILPTDLVIGLLCELGELGFDGYVAFHRYNEPLTDPRLYWLLGLRQKAVPQATSYLCVNARYLNETRLRELASLGVSKIHASVYDGRARGEAIATWALAAGIAITTTGKFQEDLLGLYDGPRLNLKRPCGAPLWEVVVASTADVVLCCKDWRNGYRFGNLRDKSLSEIVTSLEMLHTYERLSRGDRFLDLCSRCKHSRGL